MSEVKHTRGPWRAEAWGITRDAIPDEYYPIATVSVERCEWDEINANIRLIAAAPDLLKALQDAVALSERLAERGIPRNEEAQRIFDAACAAIAKATNQTTP